MKTTKTGSGTIATGHTEAESQAVVKAPARIASSQADRIERSKSRKARHEADKPQFSRSGENAGSLSGLKHLWETAKNSEARAVLQSAAKSASALDTSSLVAVRLAPRALAPRGDTEGIIERIERIDRESGETRVTVVFRPNKKGLRAVELDNLADLEGVPNGAPVVMKPSGKLVAAIDVSRTLTLANMIGVVKKQGDKLVLVARNGLSPIQRLPLDDADASLVGKTVMVDVFSPMSSSRHGGVREVLDASDPLKVRYGELAVESGIASTFPKDVLAQVQEITRTATFEPGAGVVDLRGKLFLATDNPAIETDGVSKDRDQAFHIEAREGGGHVYYYAIADKRHLIARDSPLDRYATEKMLTMYLPGFDYPVLPRELSEDLLSLNAGAPRAAIVMQIAVDANGNVLDEESKTYRAIMQSSWDGCYKDQQAYYDGKDVPALDAAQKQQLDLAWGLYQDFAKAALARGEIEDQNDGNIPAQRVTKELSVNANGFIGRALTTAGAAGLNRYHAQPKQEKTDAFAQKSQALAKVVGRPELAWYPPKESISEYLARIDKDDPCAPALGAWAMRTNERAVVSVDMHGHHGLGLKEYTWGTAPMRRNVDMYNLEQLAGVYARRVDPALVQPYTEEELTKLADRHNIVEDTMRYVERNVGEVQTAAALAPFVGKTVTGSVFDVAPGGVTFACADPKVRLFVPAKILGDAAGERLELAESGVELASQSGKVRYRVGDGGITLRIRDVDVEAGRVAVERAS
ncbi:MAG: RNB domain-containing ribonuclease [Myxococcota bacterium]